MKKLMNCTLSAFAAVSMTLAPYSANAKVDFSNFGNLKAYASVADMKLDRAQLLMDNDQSYAAKINVLKKAQKGDELRLVYYIYSDDQSSSAFSKELIAAAKRGVQVKLLLDYLQNYKRLDLLKALEQESNGNIKVKLYGRPTRNIMIDASYMAADCATMDECLSKGTAKSINAAFEDSKEQRAQNISTGGLAGGKLLLSGIYGKNPDVMSVAYMQNKPEILKQLQEGMKDSGNKSEAQKKQEKQQLVSLLKLVWEAKVEKSPLAMLKLWFAGVIYGEQIAPIIKTMDTMLPVGNNESRDYTKNSEGDSRRGKDWEHLTDYTHHKMVLLNKADGVTSAFVHGGRNIENSYHMQPNTMTSKYIFMDTDLAATSSDERTSRQMKERFDALFNFNEMAATTAEAYAMMPNDLLANLDLAGDKCATQKVEGTDKTYADAIFEAKNKSSIASSQGNKSEANKLRQEASNLKKVVAGCAKQAVLAKGELLSTQERIAIAIKNMDQAAAEFAQYKPTVNKADVIELSQSDLKASINYLENNHFRIDDKKAMKTRIYGTTQGLSAEYGKGIHEAWVNGMNRVCQLAASNELAKEDRRIILHSAYFFLPSNLLKTISNMVDGTTACPGVSIEIISNSIHTTDLSPVNIYNMTSMKSLFEYINAVRSSDKVTNKSNLASVKFLEYNAAALAKAANNDKGNFSLHTKLSVLGDSILVGSANADVRSYVMDTNNATLIVGAKDLVSKYNAWIDSKKASGVLKDETQTYLSVNRDQLAQAREAIIEQIRQHYLGEEDREGSLSKESIDGYRKKLDASLKDLDNLSVQIIPKWTVWTANQFNAEDGINVYTGQKGANEPSFSNDSMARRVGRNNEGSINRRKLNICLYGIEDYISSGGKLEGFAASCKRNLDREVKEQMTSYDNLFKGI